MAAHAQLHRGHTGVAGSVRPRVAIQTLDLELPSVMLVTEGNRLQRARGIGIPREFVGPTRRQRREGFVELIGNLDLEVRVFRLSGLEFLGFTYTIGHELFRGFGGVIDTEGQRVYQPRREGDLDQHPSRHSTSTEMGSVLGCTGSCSIGAHADAIAVL